MKASTFLWGFCLTRRFATSNISSVEKKKKEVSLHIYQSIILYARMNSICYKRLYTEMYKKPYAFHESITTEDQCHCHQIVMICPKYGMTSFFFSHHNTLLALEISHVQKMILKSNCKEPYLFMEFGSIFFH